MKKLLLTLGAVASVAAPVAAVVACSGQVDDAINKLKDGYKDDIIKYGASLSADEKAALLVKVNAIKDTASNSELLKDPAMKNIMVAKAAASTTTGTTTGTTTITLKSTMNADEVKTALAPWAKVNKALDGYVDKKTSDSVLEDLGTFVFKFDGETETINVLAKGKELLSLGGGADVGQRYTAFDTKVDAFVDGLSLGSHAIAFNF